MGETADRLAALGRRTHHGRRRRIRRLSRPSNFIDWVRSAGPEVLIASWCGAGDRVPLDKIVRDRAWQDLPAVRQQRVFCIADELLNTPAPTLIAGLYALAAAIHPEKFPSVRGLRRISDVSHETRPAGASLV